MMSSSTFTYHSPLGDLLIAMRAGRLIGLWFIGQRHFASTINAGTHHVTSAHTNAPSLNEPHLQEVINWLDSYFSGRQPNSTPPIEMIGTEFQIKVWRQLMAIPRGRTSTYGEIARAVGSSPRAVGNAVGRNPLLLVVPCHRVIAADGSLGGYAAGEAIKRNLLLREGIKI